MASAGFRYSSVMDDDYLVALSSDPCCEVLCAVEGSGKKVVKVSDQLVMKFGVGVWEGEANIQRIAYKKIDPSVVRVPLVYHSFTKGRIAYILMEYIQGKVFEELDDPNLINKVARALTHFSQIRNHVPGPLAGGAPRGILWPENEDLSFQTVRDVERFFNYRLQGDGKLALGKYDLVLCHLDILPHNIIWLEDGSMCLLDWESAGFYPRLFEVCFQRINSGRFGEFNRLLLNSMQPLTENEEGQAMLILKAFSYGQTRYFAPLPPLL